MVKNPKFAAALAVALAFGVVGVSMWTAHSNAPLTKTSMHADAIAPIDDAAIEKKIRGTNLAVSDLSVRSVGGIVILRGNGDAQSAAQAVDIVKSLGPTRVANLITLATFDDEAIRREAERELAATNALAGCTLRVKCDKGVLSVTGTVQHELQRDAARTALRAVRGAKEVKVDLAL